MATNLSVLREGGRSVVVHALRWIVMPLVYGVSICVAVVLLQALRYGSLQVAVESLRGRSLVFVQDKGSETKAVTGDAVVLVSAYNLTGESVRLTGGTSTCDCVAIGDLPLDIPSNSCSTLRVSLSASSDLRPAGRMVAFYSDVESQPVTYPKLRRE